MANRRAKVIDVNYDRLSTLPTDITHRIMTFLPAKTVAQMSILSKRWEQIWYSHPFFHLNQSSFPGKFPPNAEDLDAIVTHKLQKLSMHELVLQEFKLSIPLDMYKDFLDKWLTSAAENNVKVLELDNIHPEKRYTFSFMTISAAKSLTILRLKGCKLRQLSETCLLELCSLQKLFLTHFKDNKATVQRIVLGSPLLKHIYVEKFWGMSLLDTSRLVALNHLSISPSYTTSFYFVTASRALKILSLSNLVLGSTVFGDRNFPHLVKLLLKNCTCYGKVRISSIRLKTLSLFKMKFSDGKIEINAPNLQCLIYAIWVKNLGPLLRLPLTNNIPSHCYVRVTIGFKYDYFEAARFLDLLVYLENQKETKLLCLYIHTKLGEPHIPYMHTISIHRQARRLKAMFVDLGDDNGENVMEPLNLTTLFNGLFCCCNPNILYISVHQNLADKILEFIQQKLMKKEEPGISHGLHIVKHAKLLTSENYHECLDHDIMIEFETFHVGDNKRVMLEIVCNFN